MKKHIIFGGFDYALRWEMDQDAVFKGIDYFVDNDPALIGTTYLGKPIYGPEKLLEEDKDNILILIGSIIYHLEIEFQLRDMGFEEDVHYKWAIGFCGDEICPRLWKHVEYNDRKNNAGNLNYLEASDERLEALRMVSRLIDTDKFDTILDICAGNGRIKTFLPEGIRYIPVDYIPYSGETVVCDLTKYEFPELHFDPSSTCVLLIGSICYSPDCRWLLRKIAASGDTFICTHSDFVRINREYRRSHYTHNNAIFNHQIILEMQRLGFTMTEGYDWHLRHVIMKFERSRSL